DRFAEVGATVSVSAPELVRIARDKLLTADFLSRRGIGAPRTAPLETVAATPDDWPWPLMVKPAHGSSSRGIQIVPNIAELRALVVDEPFVAQELLQGREHTVNLFFDRQGRMRCAVPHE